MKPFKILVVDDESDMEHLITRRLKKRTLTGEPQFLFAQNGVEALETLHHHPEIAVALIDINMPHMDGFTFLSHLHEHNSCVCPIIVSAYGDLKNIRTAMNLGAYDFLTKPIEMNDLALTLNKAIRHVSEIRRHITERTQATAALQRSHQQYRELAENADYGIAIVQEGTFIFTNAALCAIIEESPNQVLQMSPNMLLQNESGDSVRESGESVRNPASDDAWCLLQITRGSREIWLETRQRWILWDGKPAILVTVRDMTAHKLHELAVEAEKKRLRSENLALRGMIRTHDRFGDLVGGSPAMQHVYELIVQAAENDVAVLIHGESGTGKELVAKTIHQLSRRTDHAFVPVNCGAIPDTLFESEFFGHRKGAFTGAHADASGLFERAHLGTLFLDKVAELSPEEQVKFLRVLQSGEYKPLGSTILKHADTRIIAATNQSLLEMVEANTFREDLFYRLYVIAIRVPPLREHREDIPALSEYFLKHCALPEARKPLPTDVLTKLFRHDWPGNIRELQSVLWRYVTTGRLMFASPRNAKSVPPPDTSGIGITGESLSEAMEAFEKHVMTQMLERYSWHRGKTAAALGITVRTLRRKITQYQIIQPYKRKLPTKRRGKSG
jgi:PAS domain S-box-containing protein